MCVQLLASALESGAGLQTAGHGLQALSTYAMGSTRAAMARADASGEHATAGAKAKRIRTAGAQDLGAARAAAVGSGVKLDSGSVLEAERQLRTNVETDAMTAILSGDNAARGLRATADQYQMAGVMGAADSLLQAGNSWKRVRRPLGYGRPFNPAGDGFVADPYAGP